MLLRKSEPHTINCVCHSIRSMFRVLGIYDFGPTHKLYLTHTVLLAFPKIVLELFCDLRKKVTSQGEQKGKKMKEEMIAKKHN